MIVYPWNENKIIKVSKSPIVVILLNFEIKFFSKYSSPLVLLITFLEITPAINRTTTNNTTPI